VVAPPLLVADWVRKPRSMLVGTFTDVDSALAWLEREMRASPPTEHGVPVETVLRYARARLGEEPGDQVTRYYTAGGYVCRDLVRCPPQGPCPDPPGREG
jgi:hypothetical protein